MVIVDNISKYCEAKGLAVTSFEKVCGLGHGIVRMWKSGKNSNPSIITLQRIEEATGIGMSAWLKEGGVNEYLRAHQDDVQRTGKAAE